MVRLLRAPLAVALAAALSACGDGPPVEGRETAEPQTAASTADQGRLIELWAAETPAFGIFVPDERPLGERAEDGSRLPALYTEEGGAALATNPLLDFLFLNMERGYDPEGIRAIAEGVASAGVDDPPTLLVRIPPISADGEEAARTRVVEALQSGAAGVVLPHVRSPEEAAAAVSFFTGAGASVWSPDNPTGTTVAMLMIEDPGALAAVQEIADTPGYSVLACGIGSLSRALGSPEAGEQGALEVLAHARRVGLPDMITANGADVAQRIAQGYLGLLMGGPEADEAIRLGRVAAGR